MRFFIITAALGLWAFAVCNAQAVPALDPESAGHQFYIAFPDTTANAADTRFPHQSFADTLQVMLYSAVNTTVTITPTGGGSPRTYTVQAGIFTVVAVSGQNDFPDPVVTQANQPVRNTFHIESADPIVVYCYMLTGYGCEAWQPLPVEDWGRGYYVSAMPGEAGADEYQDGPYTFIRQNKPFPAQALVLAAYDNTQITIRPNGALQGSPQTTITLAAGEAYMVQSTADTTTAAMDKPWLQQDVGGSVVTATKPIGVLSGNTRAQVQTGLAGVCANAYKNMMIEWLTPLEQHGKEFVYMPTYDARRVIGTPNENLNGKRAAEYVRVYSTHDVITTGTATDRVTGALMPFSTDRQPAGGEGRFFQDSLWGTALARRYKTDTASQAAMYAPGVARTNGYNDYSAWGGYQVLMIPREQWVNMAPYYAPAVPSGMEHFINVVTDTASRFKIYQETGSLFIFNRGIIPGTDLIWGTMQVTPGTTHLLEGRNGARFFGFVYGVYQGMELLRTGSARRDGAGVQSVAGRPAEYQENTGLGYGYPMAYRHNSMYGPEGGVTIARRIACNYTVMDIRNTGMTPVGLRRITLVPASSHNCKMEFLDPDAADTTTGQIQPTEVIGKARAKVRISPINPQADAYGIVEATLRTGAKFTQAVTYTARRAEFQGGIGGIEFGRVAAGAFKDTTVAVTNPLDTILSVLTFRLAGQATAFTVLIPDQPGPYNIWPHSTMQVTLRYTPADPAKRYNDTLLVNMECTQSRLPVAGGPSGTTGAEQAAGESTGVAIAVIPNPVAQNATVRFRVTSAGVHAITLYDGTGRAVSTVSVAAAGRGVRQVSVPVAGLPVGVYHVRLTDNRGAIIGTAILQVVR